MNPDFFRLQFQTRFSEILILSISELEKFHLEGKLTPEEIQLFQYNDFYFTYAQRNHPELKLISKNILPLDQNNRQYENWREVVLALEKLKENKKQVLEKLYHPIPGKEIFGGGFALPQDVRMMVLQNLSSDQIVSHCQANVSETLCSDENSLLWKELYHRDISVVPLPIETELMVINNPNPRASSSDNYDIITFFPKNIKSFASDTSLISITYKRIYNLYLIYKPFDFITTKIGSSKYFFIGSLGAEKLLPRKRFENDYDIFTLFKAAAVNNQFRIVDEYYEKFLNATSRGDYIGHRKRIVFEIIFHKGFFEMGKHLMELDTKFKLTIKDIADSKISGLMENINPEIFESAIVYILTKKEMKELYKILNETVMVRTYSQKAFDKVYLLSEIQ